LFCKKVVIFFGVEAPEPDSEVPVFGDAVLSKHCVSLRVSDISCSISRRPFCFRVFVYRLLSDATDEMTADDSDLIAFSQWAVPRPDFERVWESLVFEDNLKSSLLRYAETALLFSDMGVDDTLVSCNRLVLLHGPPGTGKTSICKGLAQKLAVRLGRTFESGVLIEINAHSLFSKWFSESGKLVGKLFSKITALLANKALFVCVLIDEVESLTAARGQASSEPSDAIRVVNAMLTQIDQLKRFPNVLVLATSNLSAAIDVAFLDRADISRLVGPPDVGARYTILAASLSELMRTHLVVPKQHLYRYLTACAMPPSDISIEQDILLLARSTAGMSGRQLRKLPVVAFALAQTTLGSIREIDARLFLQFMKDAAAK
jgi:SpoVK/Ycf46/Vps4 family AAA+-type ATPase